MTDDCNHQYGITVCHISHDIDYISIRCKLCDKEIYHFVFADLLKEKNCECIWSCNESDFKKKELLDEIEELTYITSIYEDEIKKLLKKLEE